MRLSGSGNSPAYGDCRTPIPTRSDPGAPADTCGVPALSETLNNVLPYAPKVGTYELDLYIESGTTCGLAEQLCGIDDNRPFMPRGASANADASRNRVVLTFDFATGTVTVRVSPSCRSGEHGLGGDKQCTAPRQLGDGNEVNVVQHDGGSVSLDTKFIQTNYDPFPTHNSFNVENAFPSTSPRRAAISRSPELVVASPTSPWCTMAPWCTAHRGTTSAI